MMMVEKTAKQSETTCIERSEGVRASWAVLGIAMAFLHINLVVLDGPLTCS